MSTFNRDMKSKALVLKMQLITEQSVFLKENQTKVAINL